MFQISPPDWLSRGITPPLVHEWWVESRENLNNEIYVHWYNADDEMTT